MCSNSHFCIEFGLEFDGHQYNNMQWHILQKSVFLFVLSVTPPMLIHSLWLVLTE